MKSNNFITDINQALLTFSDGCSIQNLELSVFTSSARASFLQKKNGI